MLISPIAPAAPRLLLAVSTLSAHSRLRPTLKIVAIFALRITDLPIVRAAPAPTPALNGRGRLSTLELGAT
jgi:hypothetical protein